MPIQTDWARAPTEFLTTVSGFEWQLHKRKFLRVQKGVCPNDFGKNDAFTFQIFDF